MAGLLSPDSSFYRALNSATDLVILNALTILGCVPVVTAGASLTACARVTADMVREEDDYIVRSWWASFKGNLRQSFGWWLPVLALLVLAVAENWLIGGIRGATLAGALTGLIALGTARSSPSSTTPWPGTSPAPASWRERTPCAPRRIWRWESPPSRSSSSFRTHEGRSPGSRC